MIYCSPIYQVFYCPTSPRPHPVIRIDTAPRHFVARYGAPIGSRLRRRIQVEACMYGCLCGGQLKAEVINSLRGGYAILPQKRRDMLFMSGTNVMAVTAPEEVRGRVAVLNTDPLSSVSRYVTPSDTASAMFVAGGMPGVYVR